MIGTSTVTANGNTVANPPKLVYGSTTYVQLYSIQQALKNAGIPAAWDGNTFAMTIPFEPPVPGNNVIHIQDMPTLTATDLQKVDSWTDNLGNTYAYGGITSGGNDTDVTYDLANQYASLSGVLAPSKDYSTEPLDPNIGHLEIYGDGKLLYDSGAVASNVTNPIKVSADLTGVSQLEIKLDGAGDSQQHGFLGFVNAEFVK